MSTSKSPIADRLEMHNLAALVKSARAKQAAGRPLTKREIAAVAELEKRQGAIEDRPLATDAVAVGPVVRAFMEIASLEDEALIRAAIGDVAFSSMDAIAKAFGVPASTIRTSWRRDGMPGEARRGTTASNHYRVADILLWWLARQQAREGARPRGHGRADPAREELDAIELESARLELTIRRAKAAQLTGDLISRQFACSEWHAALAVLSSLVMSLPREVKPTLCRKCAPNIAQEMERQLRSALTQFSETTITQVNEATNGADDSHNRSATNGAPSTG